MNKVWHLISYVLNLPLIPVGKTTVTLAMLIYMVLLFAILIIVSRYCRRRILERLLEKSKLDRSMQNAFAMFVQYSFIGIGGVIILNTAGIEMTALTVVAGALGLGLSLGLQTIAKSIAGGIMILIERPIRLGDRIQIGTITGDVTRIALRSTTVHTDDHFDIIVPNSEFMDQKVINWTFSSNQIILNIPVVVSSDNDYSHVKELIAEVAKSNDHVLGDPAPEVLLESFESGKLKLNLRVATEDFINSTVLRSRLNEALYKRFKESQIAL